MRQAGRCSGAGQPYAGLGRKASQGFVWNGRVACIGKDLATPLHWKTPSRILVNSMSDLLHAQGPDRWIDKIIAVMWAAQWHT